MRNENLIAAEPSAEMLEYLLKRKSVPVKNLAAPGPDRGQIETILRAATRVPDHGKLAPWYFLVFEGAARAEVGALIQKAWLVEEPEASPDKLALEGERLTRAPVVIAVVSRIREGKVPMWEQIMSAGAAAQTLCLAANALGFGSNWLTEWFAFSEAFKAGLGLDTRDHFAGFIYLGTPAAMPEERERPELSQLVRYWRAGAALNKGDGYGRAGMGLPRAGFIIPE